MEYRNIRLLLFGVSEYRTVVAVVVVTGVLKYRTVVVVYNVGLSDCCCLECNVYLIKIRFEICNL